MLKRALMLTAATAALLAGSVHADDFQDITTKVTEQLKTSTANNGAPSDILIETSGSVVVSVAGPAVEIDSPNSVTNKGTISNLNKDSAIGVQLDATAAGNGPGTGTVAFDNVGTLDLSGTGNEKTAILVTIANGDPTGTFNGDITLESGSTVKATGDTSSGIAIAGNTIFNGNMTLDGTLDMTGAGTDKTGIMIGTPTTAATMNGNITFGATSVFKLTGDNSTGIHIQPNSVVNGNLEVAGSMSILPTDQTSTTNGNVTGILIDANSSGNAVNGNVTIDTAASITAVGEGARGVVINGDLSGSFANNGSLSAAGTTTAPSTTKANPEAGSALMIAGSVAGGILNNGPASSSGDTTPAAAIASFGIAPAVVIGPGSDATSNQIIGAYTCGGASCGEGLFSFLNRGNINANPVDANNNSVAIQIFGIGSGTTCNACSILEDGFFNGGQIRSTATNDTKQTTESLVNALLIGNSAIVPNLVNSIESGKGDIIASISGSGTQGGEADAIRIAQFGSLTSLTNESIISASATTTDTSISTLVARGIFDESGTLNTIDNSGTIQATATTLDGNTQVAQAVNLSASQQDITFTNTGGGKVIGDVLFGNGGDTLSLVGTSDNLSFVHGNISFGGTAGLRDDVLDIGDFSDVVGSIDDRAGGRLDVEVHGGGFLSLTNDSIDPNLRFTANNFTVDAGGSLQLALSNAYNLAANPIAGGIVTTTGPATLAQGSFLQLGFSSFIIVPGQASTFDLIDAPLNELTVGDLSTLKANVCSNVPFLFDNTPDCLQIVPSGNRSQLILNLSPKTPAELGLHGYALQMFPFANAALTNDDALGAAVITAGLPVNGVPLDTATGNALYQQVYSEFAPNVTGASRALAIAITDQATGPVGARQRELRMYAAQPGDTTLWAQQFAVNLNQDASANTVGYRDSGYGLAFGMDGGNPADGRYGGALTFYTGDITEKDPRTSKTDTLWAMLTGYTDWRGKGFFFDTQLNAGIGQLDGHRELQVGGVTRVAQGKRDDLLGSAGATTGVILTTGSTVVTPLVSLDGMALREDGYTEHGGGDPTGGDGFDLAIKPTYYDSLRAFAGADLRQDINLGSFYLQPEGRAGYRFDFINNGEKLRGSFVSTPDSQFSLTGPDPGRGNIVLGGSLAATTGAWSINLSYDYLRGDNGSISQVGTLSLLGRI